MTSIEFRPPMNLNQLRALEALEATRSFTGAAHRLGLTQPAVSVQLRKLQERHGVKLFWRRGRYLDAILFSLPYCDQSIVLFVSIHPPRAKRPCLDAIALDDQPMVARHRGSMTRQIFERRLARQSIRPRVVMELDAWEALSSSSACRSLKNSRRCRHFSVWWERSRISASPGAPPAAWICRPAPAARRSYRTQAADNHQR
jgi:DNA-binding transcriptional LysR family regulator